MGAKVFKFLLTKNPFPTFAPRIFFKEIKYNKKEKIK
jgi:hypothetical protein